MAANFIGWWWRNAFKIAVCYRFFVRWQIFTYNRTEKFKEKKSFSSTPVKITSHFKNVSCLIILTVQQVDRGFPDSDKEFVWLLYFVKLQLKKRKLFNFKNNKLREV